MKDKRLKDSIRSYFFIFGLLVLSSAIFLSNFASFGEVYAQVQATLPAALEADEDDDIGDDMVEGDEEERRELEAEKAEAAAAATLTDETELATEGQSDLELENSVLTAFNNNGLAPDDGQSKKEAPALPQANEVAYTAASTAKVNNGLEFLAAYVNSAITRIELMDDIDLNAGPRDAAGRVKDLQPDVARYTLMRSLIIDGKGHTLKSTGTKNDQFFENDPLFKLGRITSTQTIHLKDLKAWTRGLNYIKNYDGNEIEGWQLILDDVDFRKTKHVSPADKVRKDGFDQVHRVAKLPRGQIFLRNSVKMESSGENFYVGQVTVEPGADVFGEITHHNYSTWWFVRQEAKLEKTVNIGENAHVFLGGKPRYKQHDPAKGILAQNATYPAIFSHWQAINVHQGATLSVRKPGHTYEFKYATNGNKHKYINVFEDATIEGITTSLSGNQGTFDDITATAIGHFYAAPGSNVRFISGGTSPVINLKAAGSTFELNRPATYDIRNISELRGAKAVRIGKNGYFKLTAANIGVWDGTKVLSWDQTRERHLHGPADETWSDVAVIAGENGRPLAGSSPDSRLYTNWQTTKYSRIASVDNDGIANGSWETRG
jgi:hypothetical protein